jgi:hypothetical protein
MQVSRRRAQGRNGFPGQRPIAENRCAAFFVSSVSPDSETRIGAAVWARCRSCHRSPARILGQAPWDHDCPTFNRWRARPLDGISCKNIRLSADVAKSLSRRRNCDRQEQLRGFVQTRGATTLSERGHRQCDFRYHDRIADLRRHAVVTTYGRGAGFAPTVKP